MSFSLPCLVWFVAVVRLDSTEDLEPARPDGCRRSCVRTPVSHRSPTRLLQLNIAQSGASVTESGSRVRQASSAHRTWQRNAGPEQLRGPASPNARDRSRQHDRSLDDSNPLVIASRHSSTRAASPAEVMCRCRRGCHSLFAARGAGSAQLGRDRHISSGSNEADRSVSGRWLRTAAHQCDVGGRVCRICVSSRWESAAGL